MGDVRSASLPIHRAVKLPNFPDNFMSGMKNQKIYNTMILREQWKNYLMLLINNTHRNFFYGNVNKSSLYY